ncbi:MAG: LysM peptidoglycan-binding domain-containing protein [Anaerolineae bacterium]|nr:LysM peptidoglycan-binding domain-containing protein [Anaerolineae bacterium]
MNHKRLIEILLLALVVTAFGASPTAAQPSRAYEIVDLVNQFRADNGLPALEIDSSLMTAAQRHAEWMASTYTYSHTGEGGSTPQQRATAAGYVGYVYENFAGGTNQTPQETIGWWSRSAVHLQTMLLPNHVHIGAGYAANESQNLYVLLVGKSSQFAPGGSREDEADPEENQPQAPLILTAVPGEDGSVVHTVDIGQTLWDISAVYGVELDDLRTLNYLKPGAVLHPGDQIIIRLGEGQPPPPSPTPPTTHTVQEGESTWTIAAIYGLTLDEIRAWNQLEDNVIHPGDVLLIRAPNPTPTETPETTAPPAEIAAAGDLTPTLTAAPSITPTAAPTNTPAPTATLTPSPTPTPEPARSTSSADEDGGVSGQTLLIGVIIALGLMAVIGVGVMLAWLRRG